MGSTDPQVVDFVRDLMGGKKDDSGAAASGSMNTDNPANGDFGVVKGGNGKFRVHKMSKTGQPQGGAMGEYDSEDAANAHADGLNKTSKKTAKAASAQDAKKGYGDYEDSDDFPGGLIDQDDERAQYDPIGGMKGGGKACANCHWFVGGSSCMVVAGPISPTGLSKLWLTQDDVDLDDGDSEKPTPVYIVGQDEKGAKPVEDCTDDDVLGATFTTSGAVAETTVTGKSKADDSNQKFAVDKTDKHPAKLKLNNKAQIEGAITALTTGQYRGNKITPPLSDEEKKTAKGRISSAIDKATGTGVDDDWKKQEKARLEGKSESGSKEAPPTILSRLKGILGLGPLPTASNGAGMAAAFKALDNGRWVAWWTNSAKDRHDEQFTTPEIEAYIARADKGIVPMPELWYRHMSVPHGQADWLGHVGALTLAAGHFYETEVGRKMYAHYKAHDGQFTMSHGYLFDPAHMGPEGQYGPFNSYELSPMYAGEESNGITALGVKELEKMITPAKRADLEKIIGPEMAAAYLQFGEQKTKELETLGVKFKSFENPNSDASDEVARAAATTVSQAQKDLGEAFVISTKSLMDRIGALEQQNKELGDFLREQFQLAPRASQAAQTRLDAGNPYIAFLAQKNADPQGNQPPDAKDMEKVGGVMGTIMGLLAQQPKG